MQVKKTDEPYIKGQWPCYIFISPLHIILEHFPFLFHFIMLQIKLSSHEGNEQVFDWHVVLLALGHAQYILWSTDPPTSQDCPRQEKKVDIQAFFYFFLRHCKKLGCFFTKSVGFLLKYRQNLLKILEFPDDSQRVDFYFLFFSSDEGKKPLSGSVDHRIYWEWPYEMFFSKRHVCHLL